MIVRRALVLATLCTELTVGSSLQRRQDLAEEALAIARRCGEDATVVRVINHVLLPLSLPHLLDALDRAFAGSTLPRRIGGGPGPPLHRGKRSTAGGRRQRGHRTARPRIYWRYSWVSCRKRARSSTGTM